MTRDPSEMLTAANHAWRENENAERATAIAQTIIDEHPDSSEARYAKKLLIEIGVFEEPPPSETQKDKVQKIIGSVTITDVDISFWSMVNLMVKFAFAVIPAALIIALFVVVLSMMFGGLFGK